ncbi:restriction endonuclease subunit S [Candidatus Poseidoniaceae archaeon]|nr:restriction endonuclease subunit S [Candidatus Poseidoniaceae archaeon]
MMSELWPLKKLSEICDVSRGKTITRKQTQEGDVPVVAGGINSSYSHNTANRPANVITVSGSGANAGYVNFWPIPIFASDCSTILPLDPNVLDVRFVYYAMLNLQDYISTELRRGAAQPHVYAKDLALLEISLPPLEEQQRIVSILDEAFNKLAVTSEQIEQKTLSIDNLFDGALDSEYANHSELNMGTLNEIIESTFYGPRFAKDAYTPDGVVSLRTTDMADDGLFEFKDPPRIPLDAKQLEKYRLIDGDILIARSGSVGKCAIYTEDLGEAMPSAYLIRMRLKKDLVHPRFVLRYLLSRTGQRHLIGHSTSSTMANINSKNLRNIPFSFPSLAEQMRIIEKLDGLHYESKTLKQTYHSGLNNLVELKQSILQEAFTGKLTGGTTA